jgi:hypothetical protein
MTDRPRSLLAPLVVAVIGLIPLGVLASTPTRDASLPVVAFTQQSLPERPQETVVVTTPPPTIDGVSAEVARVLAAQGFAAREVVPELPASVVAVLRDRNVVLTVAVPEP